MGSVAFEPIKAARSAVEQDRSEEFGVVIAGLLGV